MQSYLNSPLYQALVAQVARGGQKQALSPGEAVANGLSQVADAWALKRYEGKEQKRENDSNAALADALSNEYDYGVTPGTNTVMSRLKASGNPDATNQMAQALAQNYVQQNAQANAPITPYQQKSLDMQQGQNDENNLYRAQSSVDQAMDSSRNFNLNMRRTQAQIDQASPDFAAAKAKAVSDATKDNQLEIAQARNTQGGNVQSVQQAQDGSLIVVRRNGQVDHMNLDGTPVKGTQAPEAVFNRSAAQAGGKGAGTAAESQPTADANFKIINDTLNSFDDDKVKNQAGYALGYGSILPTVPGVNSDFNARMAQLKGQTFLQAYNTLKGGGQITEVEGAKAESAIARLSKAQTKDEFYSALKDAQTTFSDIYGATKKRAQRGAVIPQLQNGAAPAASGLPGGVTEEDIQHTLKLHPEITREQLLQKLGGQ